MFRGTAPLRRAAASFAKRVVVTTMSSGARRCGNDVVGAGPVVSWSGLCGFARPVIMAVHGNPDAGPGARIAAFAGLRPVLGTRPHLWRGSSSGSRYSRVIGPIAVTWVTHSPDLAQWKWGYRRAGR